MVTLRSKNLWDKYRVTLSDLRGERKDDSRTTRASHSSAYLSYSMSDTIQIARDDLPDLGKYNPPLG